jgi:O-antigen/teichoic acid export membrane protein
MVDLLEILPGIKHELAGQITTTFLGAALIILLTHLLEPKQYGLLFLVISILGFIRILSEGGVANSGARYVAEYKERAPEQIRYIISTSLLYNLSTIIIVSTVLILGHRHLAAFFNEHKLSSLLLYGVFFVIFGTLTTYARVILQGFEEIELSAGVHIINILARFISAIGVVILGYGVWGALTGYIFGFALASLLGLTVIYLKCYRGWKTAVTVETGLRRRIAEYTLPLAGTSTTKAIEVHIDTILVGLFLTPVSVGFYALAKQITQFLETPAYALGFSLAPTYGAKKAQSNMQHVSKLYEISFEYSLLVYLPAAAGVVLVAEPMIQYVFGSKYLGTVPVLQVLAIYIVFRSLTTITEDSLDYLGRAKLRALLKIPTVILNVILNIILIPRIGVIGAPIATVVSYGIFTLMIIFSMYSELNLRIKYIRSQIASIFAITVAISGIVIFGLQFVSGLLSLSCVIIFAGIVWIGLAKFTGFLNIYDIELLISR